VVRALREAAPATLAAGAVTGAAALVLLFFVVQRARLVPLTYDEAAAYLRYISRTDVLSVFSFSVATNHFANTVLTRLTASIAGTCELALRLPNVAAFVVYLFFAFLILARLTHRRIAAAGFVVLNLNPYVLEYFALCRGYGLSLGLLMGSLYFLLKAADAEPGSTQAASAWRSLLLGGGAAAASFSSLTLFMALWVVWCLVVIARSRPADALTVRPRTLSKSIAVEPRRVTAWLFFTVAFTALCASQDAALSPSLYERLSVSVAGFSEAELQGVKVFQTTLRGRPVRLIRRGTLWELPGLDSVAGLRIEIPRGASESQGQIQVMIGTQRFTHTLTGKDGAFLAVRYSGSFQALEALPPLALARSRLEAFEPVMNWRGDRTLLRAVAVRAGLWSGLLAVLVFVLHLAMFAAARWRNAIADYSAPLVWVPAWVAALCGYPLWMLFRSGELYYGGTTGLVADTLTSLAVGFLHSSQPPRGEERLLLAVLAALLLAAVGAVAVRARQAGIRSVSAALCLLSLLALTAFAIELEHVLFGARYPVGRTALFIVPLFMLAVVTALDAACRIGRPARACATAVLLLATALAGWHFGRVANVSRAHDWADDAFTRSVVADVRRLSIERADRPATVSLGVDALFLPAAVYYADRPGTPAIRLVVTPTIEPLDFLYTRATGPDTNGEIVRQFPSGAALVRRSPPQ
jgi:hypothetical protein